MALKMTKVQYSTVEWVYEEARYYSSSNNEYNLI